MKFNWRKQPNAKMKLTPTRSGGVMFKHGGKIVQFDPKNFRQINLTEEDGMYAISGIAAYGSPDVLALFHEKTQAEQLLSMIEKSMESRSVFVKSALAWCVAIVVAVNALTAVVGASKPPTAASSSNAAVEQNPAIQFDGSSVGGDGSGVAVPPAPTLNCAPH